MAGAAGAGRSACQGGARLADCVLSVSVRSARTELNVPPARKLSLVAHRASDETARAARSPIARRSHGLRRLAKRIAASDTPAIWERRRVVGRSEAHDFVLAARRHDRHRRRESALVERRPLPPRRNATASPSGSPTRTSPSAPSPRRSRKPALDHEAKAAEAERLRAALERLGLDSTVTAKAVSRVQREALLPADGQAA